MQRGEQLAVRPLGEETTNVDHEGSGAVGYGMPFLAVEEFESGCAVGEKEGERSVVGMFFAPMCHRGGGWEGAVENEAEGGVVLRVTGG